MTDDELAKAPEGTKGLKIAGLDKMNFVMTVSALDCTGCGSCANVCPGKKGEKALTMKPLAEEVAKQNLFAYGQELPEKKEIAEKFKETTVKGSLTARCGIMLLLPEQTVGRRRDLSVPTC